MVNVFPDPKHTVTALANFIVQQAKESIEKRGRFDFVLSGGSSPRALYELLASNSYHSLIRWDQVCFFFGDERHVPDNHPDSNFRMASESLFVPLGISGQQIFPVNTTLPPAEAARDYERTIRSHFQSEPPSFDLVLLGLGDNSHTASLFPHTPVLHEMNAFVREVYVKELQKYRITLTAPAINASRQIIFLVYGATKADAVRHVIQDPVNFDEYPAQLVNLPSGNVSWFLDEGAASRLRLQA